MITATGNPAKVGLTKPLAGKELILATKAYTGENRLRSWWVILSSLAIFAITTTATIQLTFMPLRIFFSIVSGLMMVRIFVIYHDHQHHAILDRSKAANFLMNVVGILSLAPSSVWKSSHNHHHAHNSKLRSSHIGSYPIMTRERYESSSKKEQRIYLFMRHPLTIFAGYITTFLLGMCLLPFIRDPKRHWDGLFALALHAVFIGLLFHFGGISAVLLVVILPISIAAGMGSYLFYAQHNFPMVKHTDNAGWTHHGAALEASSFMRMPAIMHWFTANIGYHHIHHLNAKIPFYRLPEIMKDMPELQHPKSTSLHPAEVLRCLRLKVWDCQQKRMAAL